MLTAYTLDRDDRIVAVSNPEWDSFALDNDGPAACAAHVVGARLADAITGDPVRMFMTAILMRVRASGQPETVPYRCDSDRVRRFYTMTLTPLAYSAVRITHDLHHDEAGAVTVRIRPAAPGRRGVLRCSLCCRIDEGRGWADPFDGGKDRDLRVIHTICPDCKGGTIRRARSAPPRPIHMPAR
jgi:hypothetical protein